MLVSLDMLHALLLTSLVFTATPAATGNQALGPALGGVWPMVGKHAWLAGGTPSGMAGIHRLMAGHAGNQPGLTFALSGGFSRASGFLVPGDSLSESMLSGAVLWTLDDHLEIGLSGLGTYVTDSYFSGASALEIFPGLNLKGNIGTFYGWGLSAAFNLFIPSVSGVHGALSPGNSAFTFTAIGSRMLLPWLELTTNAGFILDRVRYAATEAVNPAQRYASAVVRSNRIALGAGVSSLFAPVWRNLSLGPYAELTGQIAPGAAFQDNPWRVTLGTKAYVDKRHTLEVDVGVDARLLGAPHAPRSPYPGAPPWGVFAVVSYHSSLAALRFGEPQYIMVNSNQPKPVTVTISGRVQDTNAQVLIDATITVDEGKKAFLTVDPNTGYYETLPILAINGNVVVACSAPGYLPQQRTIPVHATDTALEVDFHLDPKTLTATLRGLVYNARNGKGVPKASVFISGNGFEGSYVADERGVFVILMRPGQYDVYVSASGFQTHKYPTRVPDNAEVVLHAGLHPKEDAGR